MSVTTCTCSFILFLFHLGTLVMSSSRSPFHQEQELNILCRPISKFEGLKTILKQRRKKTLCFDNNCLKSTKTTHNLFKLLKCEPNPVMIMAFSTPSLRSHLIWVITDAWSGRRREGCAEIRFMFNYKIVCNGCCIWRYSGDDYKEMARQNQQMREIIERMHKQLISFEGYLLFYF